MPIDRSSRRISPAATPSNDPLIQRSGAPDSVTYTAPSPYFDDSHAEVFCTRGTWIVWNDVRPDFSNTHWPTMHPHITGHRSRMPVLERLIRHMKAKGGCWFATHAQVAEWCRDNA